MATSLVGPRRQTKGASPVDPAAAAQVGLVPRTPLIFSSDLVGSCALVCVSLYGSLIGPLGKTATPPSASESPTACTPPSFSWAWVDGATQVFAVSLSLVSLFVGDVRAPGVRLG